MKYLLALDGGQTHSLAIIANERGAVLGAATGGSANHFREPGGRERFIRSMRECIEGALTQARVPRNEVSAAYYALTGVHAEMPELLHQILPAGKQIVAGDKDASLAGATLERPAVLVLAGTGAIACAVDGSGHEAVTGGWGYLMGDEGSASWIAPLALSAATRAEDGRGPATVLQHAIPLHYGVVNLRALHPVIYEQRINRVQLASVAQVVGEAANAGDQVARSIMKKAGTHLGKAGVVVLLRLGLQSVPTIVSTAGGVFNAGNVILEPMMVRIHRDCPHAIYQPPRFPPVIGALFLAMQSLSIPITNDVKTAVIDTHDIWERRK